jgi:hypothetical protein
MAVRRKKSSRHPVEWFVIQNGVRRAIASREAGRLTIPAIIRRRGERAEHRPRMRLDQLLSPKESIERDSRFLRIEPPIDEPIEVEPLGEPGQPMVVTLATVTLD